MAIVFVKKWHHCLLGHHFIIKKVQQLPADVTEELELFNNYNSRGG